MGWRLAEDRPLYYSMMIRFNDEYMRHQGGGVVVVGWGVGGGGWGGGYKLRYYA